MKFTTPCFVRVEDAEKRKELIEWMASIGYRQTLCARKNRGRIVNSNRAGFAFVDNIEMPMSMHDCGTNIDLFKALAAMNDENDREQWLVSTGKLSTDCHWFREGEMVHFNSVQKLCSDYEQPTYFRKATAEEIIEHFKKTERYEKN